MLLCVKLEAIWDHLSEIAPASKIPCYLIIFSLLTKTWLTQVFRSSHLILTRSQTAKEGQRMGEMRPPQLSSSSFPKACGCLSASVGVQMGRWYENLIRASVVLSAGEEFVITNNSAGATSSPWRGTTPSAFVDRTVVCESPPRMSEGWLSFRVLLSQQLL